MGKEVKIGLAVLGVLALVFGALLFRRLVASDVNTTAADATAETTTPETAPQAQPIAANDKKPADHSARGIGIGRNLHRADPPAELAKTADHAHARPAVAVVSEPTPLDTTARDNPFQQREAAADPPHELRDDAGSDVPRRLRDASPEPARLEAHDEHIEPVKPRNPLRRVSAEEPIAEGDANLDLQPAADSIPDAASGPTVAAEFDAPSVPDAASEPAAQPRALDAGPTEAAGLEPRMAEVRAEEEAPADVTPEPASREPVVQAQLPRDRYAAPQPVAAVEPVVPENGKYTVQPNDTLSLISEKVYGNNRYFKALAEHNRSKLPHPDRLTVGTIVAVPPVSVLEQNYPALCPKQRRSALVKSRTVPASTRPSASRGENVYVVEEGDTLFDIARHELGKASRWAEIYDLNRDTLGADFDYLQPGTELAMPAKAASGDTITRQRDERYQR